MCTRHLPAHLKPLCGGLTARPDGHAERGSLTSDLPQKKPAGEGRRAKRSDKGGEARIRALTPHDIYGRRNTLDAAPRPKAISGRKIAAPAAPISPTLYRSTRHSPNTTPYANSATNMPPPAAGLDPLACHGDGDSGWARSSCPPRWRETVHAGGRRSIEPPLACIVGSIVETLGDAAATIWARRI